jgi:hypothetical protein
VRSALTKPGLSFCKKRNKNLKNNPKRLNIFLILTAFQNKLNTVKPLYNGQPWNSKKWWSLFAPYSYKIASSFEKLGLNMAVADRWSFFRGGG